MNACPEWPLCDKDCPHRCVPKMEPQRRATWAELVAMVLLALVLIGLIAWGMS